MRFSSRSLRAAAGGAVAALALATGVAACGSSDDGGGGDKVKAGTTIEYWASNQGDDPAGPAGDQGRGAIGLRNYASETNVYWNQLMAAAIVVSAPVVIAFLAAQKLIVRGLTAGGVK